MKRGIERYNFSKLRRARFLLFQQRSLLATRNIVDCTLSWNVEIQIKGIFVLLYLRILYSGNNDTEEAQYRPRSKKTDIEEVPNYFQ